MNKTILTFCITILFTHIYSRLLVTDTVTIINNEPLIGVNVSEKGTTHGTNTDYDGDFRLLVTDGNAVLEFSYIRKILLCSTGI